MTWLILALVPAVICLIVAWRRAGRAAGQLADPGRCHRDGCSCPREVHEHYRPGTDCGQCGRLTCPAFR